MRDIVIHAPASVSYLLLRYQLAREQEMAELARAKSISSRPATKSSDGRIGNCVHCDKVPTLDILFNYQVLLREGESFSWVVVEKHCHDCAKVWLNDAGAFSTLEVPHNE